MNSSKTFATELEDIRQRLAFCGLLTALVLAPEIVLAGPIEDGVDWLLDLLTSGIARSMAIVGIAILGYLAWAGRITAEACGKYLLGVVLVFGGAAIVDLLIRAVS